MRTCVQITVVMDAKDLRIESALSDRNNDGSKYSQSGGIAIQCDRNKSYQDIGSNALAKVDTPSTRPCAVIGPDRIVPPPTSHEPYLKKGPAEPWPCMDNIYHHTRRPPEYPHKLANYQNPTRNISPRQTFQENMQRIMVPPSYNSVKLSDEPNYNQITDRNSALPKNIKLNVPPEAKFCDVPYNVYPTNNEPKNVRNSDMLSSVNPTLTRSGPHGWPPNSVNIRPTRTYGASELYQYQEFTNCAGPRPVVPRPSRTVPEDPGYVYAEPFYHQEGNIRFKPYPTAKDRFPQQRYDYIGNYTNSFHPPPPFPTHKYELQKAVPPHPYPPYPPIKYLDRPPEPVMDGYPRNHQGGYNISYRNQIMHPNFGPVLGNCPQNKIHSYPPDSHVKTGAPSKLPYDNTKAYIEYDNGRPKMYPPSDSYIVNEMGRMHPMKGQVIMPNYSTLNMHNIPPSSYYKKDNQQTKNYEYIQAHFRGMDPNINIHNPMVRHPSMFSPNTLAISPTDSVASNDTLQNLGTSQEDCGYVSQSSTASGRSMDSSINRISNESIRKYYENRFGPVIRTSPMMSKSELNSNNNSKEKKNIDVRQFLQMWNEGDEETDENISKEVIIQTGPKTDNNFNKIHDGNNQPNQQQLYVLGLVNVPSEELGKYEHIQKVSKLPENIKGYNHIELLNQFEEAIESSNMTNYKAATSTSMPSKGLSSKLAATVAPSRPLSPLDVEAKISQSVIHKEVGCNFEIKPCSPKMLNVEVATPVQNILVERAIEKVANPVMLTSPRLNGVEANTNYNDTLKQKDHRLNISNDSNRIPSCKMVNTHFANNNNIDAIKSSYSLQDLESNSGLCFASLPRLDNDIELNFPEVNQQFINATKRESTVLTPSLRDLPTLELLDQSDTERKSQLNTGNSLSQEIDSIKSPCIADSDKEVSKLSKYRKNKAHLSDPKENLNAVRTDSVIIKNPDNIKNHEESFTFPPNYLNKQVNDIQKTPINLTSQVNITGDAENISDVIKSQGTHKEVISSIDMAIDFSLNKSISSSNIENIETTTQKAAESPTPNGNDMNNSILDDHLPKLRMFSDSTQNMTSTYDIPNKLNEDMILNHTKYKDSETVPQTAMNVNNEECVDSIDKSSSLEAIFIKDDYMSPVQCVKDINDSLLPLEFLTSAACENSNKKIINKISDTVATLKNTDNIFTEDLKTENKLLQENCNIETASENLTCVPNVEELEVVKDACIEIPGVKVTYDTELDTKLKRKNFNQVAEFSASTETHNFDCDNSQSINTDITVETQAPEQAKQDSECSLDSPTRENNYQTEVSKNKETESTLDLPIPNSIITVRENNFQEKIIEGEHVIDLPEITRQKMDIAFNILSNNEKKNPCLLNLREEKHDCDINLSNSKGTEDLLLHFSENNETSQKADVEKEVSSNALTNSYTPALDVVMPDTDDLVSDTDINPPNNHQQIETIKKDSHKADEAEFKSISDCYIHTPSPENNLPQIAEIQNQAHSVENIKIINRNIRYLSYGSKEMYSPWLQKLVMFCEGYITHVDTSKSDECHDGINNSLVNEETQEIKLSYDHCLDVNESNNERDENSDYIASTDIENDMTDIINHSNALRIESHIEDNLKNMFRNEKEDEGKTNNQHYTNKHDCNEETNNMLKFTQNTENIETSTDKSDPISNLEKISCSSPMKLKEQLFNQCDCDVEIPKHLYEQPNCRDETSKKCDDTQLIYKTKPNDTLFKSDEKIYEPEYSNKPKRVKYNSEITKLEDRPFNCQDDIPSQLFSDEEPNDFAKKNNSYTEISKQWDKQLDSIENRSDNADVQTHCSDDISEHSEETALFDKQSNSNMQSNCKDALEPFSKQSNCIDEIIQQWNRRSNCEEETPELFNKDSYHGSGKANESNKQSACHAEVSEDWDTLTNSNYEVPQQPVEQSNCSEEVPDENHVPSDCNKEVLKHWNDLNSNCNDTISEQQNRYCNHTIVDDKISKELSSCDNGSEQKLSNEQSDCNVEVREQLDKQLNCIIEEERSATVEEGNAVSTKIETTDPIFLNKKHQSLKRSLSDSALNTHGINSLSQEPGDSAPFIWPFKRRKINDIDNTLAQNLCNIIQSNRRNSISSFYNEDNVSFCILIDNSCILSEEQNDQENICYTELSEDCLEKVEHDFRKDKEYAEEITEIVSTAEQGSHCDYSDSYVMQDGAEEYTETWVDDVACVETVISDDIAEDIEVSGLQSPNDDVISDNEESGVFSSTEHSEKVKYIYGDKMCNDDAQFVETLYNTPQMDVNKTLVQREILNSGDYYDNDSLEKILSDSTSNVLSPYIPEYTEPVFSPRIKELQKHVDNIEEENVPLHQNNALDINIDTGYDKINDENIKIGKSFITEEDTVHSCASSVENVFTYKESDDNTNYITSSSPEVSSTTSEEKNSAILLKITNYKGSRISQMNDVRNDKSPRCKFTEDKGYAQSHSNFSLHRPLLTKAAQKYIPPLKESMRDLKVKLTLPQHSLIKLKQLKKSKDEPKVSKQNVSVPRISKKPKPKFEDVLKSIDEIQFKMHKEKTKKSKKSIPKVVIKKNENGSHYASTSNKDEYNPDLTGRKWQPWVFIEKNNFIDKMAIRNKTKAVYSHRKRTYVLAEKFQKYKSVNSTNFVISPPISNCPSTGLKYTIRLKHNY